MMLRKMLLSTVLASSVMAMPAVAQEMSEERWGEVREFLESNPPLLEQLGQMMEQPSPQELAAMDKEKIEANAAALFEDESTPFLGNPDGDIQIVKFSDYSCGHCQTMNGHLEELMAENPRIQVRIMEFPILGERSQLAAQFATAVHSVAGDEAYGKVHDALFESREPLNGDKLRELAEAAGADPLAVFQAMQNDDVTAQVVKALDLGRELGVTGTPGLVVGDVLVRGAIPVSAMEGLIAEQFPDAE